MRTASANFSNEQLAKAVQKAHEKNVPVFLTCNTLPRNDELDRLPAFLEAAQAAGVDAIIVADLGVMNLVKQYAPKVEIHISTQAGIVNYAMANALYDMGAKRIVLARELSLDDIAQIRAKIPADLEIETFVHGAMCMSFSGRCLLSAYLNNRDANRGDCSQPCRWEYALVEKKRPNEYMDITEDKHGSYIFNSRDMCMIEHLPDLIENGVDSFKIEGRMKSIHYVSTVTNCYRAAVDAYLESPAKFEAIKGELLDELWKVAQRELATGFYYQTPTENEQLFGARRKIPQYKFVGEVVAFDEETMTATIRQRNVILEGDAVEFYGPGFRHFETYIKDLHDADGNKIDRAPNPMELLTIPVPQAVQAGDMIRARKEGLVNLYKSDGSSKTVRA